MITDADIIKLKRVFVTKDDLKRFATKDDLIEMETRIKTDVIKGVADYLQEHIFPVLNEHEKRLDRLEKHVGGFPALT